MLEESAPEHRAYACKVGITDTSRNRVALRLRCSAESRSYNSVHVTSHKTYASKCGIASLDASKECGHLTAVKQWCTCVFGFEMHQRQQVRCLTLAFPACCLVLTCRHRIKHKSYNVSQRVKDLAAAVLAASCKVLVVAASGTICRL